MHLTDDRKALSTAIHTGRAANNVSPHIAEADLSTCLDPSLSK